MEVKYYKDFRHNFLILKNIHTSVNQYQRRMITDNQIQGLLTCKERHINGEMLLYYEITSKQSLASLYECGRIGMELLCRLFVQLKMTWDGMSGFLLEERCLLLKPEFIFLDVESGGFSFLYYPFEPEEDYMQTLLEFLTEKVDSEDSQAVDVSYKMLELVEREQFMLDEVLQWFEQDYSPIEEAEDELSAQINQNLITKEGRTEEDFEYGNLMEEKPKVKGRRLFEANNKITVGVMLLLLGIAGACGYFYNAFELSERELICFYAVLMAVAVIFIFCVIYLLYERLFLPKKINSGVGTNNESWQKEDAYQYQFPMQEKNTYDNQAYGNTVFIPWTENCENKLYGMGKGNKNHIDLNHLPITVGKLAGSVDMVINDQSMSRRHVKFAREGGKICMTDLNSTNGTFKNGMRLEPNTSEILEPGDEIRLGKLKFIYR